MSHPNLPAFRLHTTITGVFAQASTKISWLYTNGQASPDAMVSDTQAAAVATARSAFLTVLRDTQRLRTASLIALHLT